MLAEFPMIYGSCKGERVEIMGEESLDVLDLSVRSKQLKRPASPEYKTTCIRNPPKKRKTVYVDTQTSQYSPVSNSDSEVSQMSTEGAKTPNLSPPPPPSTFPAAKTTRPFKAYLKDQFSLGIGLATSGVCDPPRGHSSVSDFTRFRESVLSQVQSTNRGTNQNMRRVPQNAQNRTGDPTYWEKRRKNNEAAKRSRDARRAKEDEIAIRCVYLEQENIKLKFEIATMRAAMGTDQRYMRDQDVYHHT